MTMRLMAASVAVLIGSTMSSSAQQPTFSAKREAVRVDALVTDRGKIVTGLGQLRSTRQRRAADD